MDLVEAAKNAQTKKVLELLAADQDVKTQESIQNNLETFRKSV